MNRCRDHWSGSENCSSTGGSRPSSSASFARMRSSAASAASRSPAVPGAANKASILRSFSRSNECVDMDRLLERDDFSSNRHLALLHGWSMIPRVEPEGMLFRKPVSTFRDPAQFMEIPRVGRHPAQALRTRCRSIDHHTKMLQSFWHDILRDDDAPIKTRSAACDALSQLKVD